MVPSGTGGLVLPPGISVTLTSTGATPNKQGEKRVKTNFCPVCKRGFMTQGSLKNHMLVHQPQEKKDKPQHGQVAGIQITQEIYNELPNVKSVMNRCLPCLKSFPSGLRYKIHIKQDHGGKEPQENYDPEKCVQPDDFICLICIKKFKNRNGLKGHIQTFHLGGLTSLPVTPNSKRLAERTREKENQEEQDPLAVIPVEVVLGEGEENGSEQSKEETAEKVTENGIGGDENGATNNGDVETTKEETETTKNNGDVETTKDETETTKNGVDNTSNNKDDDEIMIIKEEVAPVPKSITLPSGKVLSGRDRNLVEKMLNLLKRYLCEFCTSRFETKFALNEHERSHLSEHKKLAEVDPEAIRKKLKLNADGTPREKRETKQGSIQKHDNDAGPVCFKCSQICKDTSNLRNHVLSHYYRIFDPLIPQTKPFPCPECQKPSRDKITLIRHFAFTHQKLFELTEVTPAHLVPLGGGTPKKLDLSESVEPSTEPPTEAPVASSGETETQSAVSGDVVETSSVTSADPENSIVIAGAAETSAEIPANAVDNNDVEEIDGNVEKKEEVKPAPIARRGSLVDDCKAPIIDGSSDESGDEDVIGGVKVKLDKDSTRYLYAWINKNLENPFPTPEQMSDLATESALTVKQVEGWFRNIRHKIGVPEIPVVETPKKAKVVPKKNSKKKSRKASVSTEEEEGGTDYVVEKILDSRVEYAKRGRSCKTKYLVKWLGWDRVEDQTWEPLEHLQDPDGTCQALEEFEARQKAKAKEESENESKPKEPETVVTLSSSPLPEVVDLEDDSKDEQEVTVPSRSNSPPPQVEVNICTPESGKNDEVEAENQQEEENNDKEEDKEEEEKDEDGNGDEENEDEKNEDVEMENQE